MYGSNSVCGLQLNCRRLDRHLQPLPVNVQQRHRARRGGGLGNAWSGPCFMRLHHCFIHQSPCPSRSIMEVAMKAIDDRDLATMPASHGVSSSFQPQKFPRHLASCLVCLVKARRSSCFRRLIERTLSEISGTIGQTRVPGISLVLPRSLFRDFSPCPVVL